tara:strand:- start:2293 stop:2760 length:468 start_codon:yes stop_codon:yes gene_type:complete
MYKYISRKNFFFIIAIISIFTLVSAVFIEYVLGIKPCKLCLYQRYPYILSIFFCFFGYSQYNKNFWLYLLSFTFLLSLILSIYHVGIENYIFPEFSGCSADNLNIIDKQILLNSLNNFIPNCKDVTYRILGLSLATINVLISGLILIISLLIMKK